MLKNRAFFLLFLLLFLGFERLGAQESIKAIVLKNFPPQYITDKDGKPTGFAIEMIEEVAKRAGYDIEYIVVDSWPQSYELFYEKKIGDIIPNAGITPERQKDTIFTVPMETFDIGMFKRSASAHLKKYADTKDSLVVVLDDNLGHTIMKNRGHPKDRLLVVKTHEEALFKLASGEADVLVFAVPVMQKLLYDLGLDNKIEHFGESLQEVKRAIRVQKERPELAEKLNSALVELLNSPKYQEIYTKYYSKPAQYWTTKRLLMVACVLFLILGAGMSHWRYRSLKKINLELAISKEQYMEFVEGTSDLVIKVDSQGYITYVNKSSEAIWGVSPQECIGKSAFDFVYPDDREQTLNDFTSWIEDGLSCVDYQNRQVDGSGNIHHLLWTINLHYDKNKNASHINSIARDITKQVEMEAQADAQRNIIIEQSKNAAIGHMIGIIAHQWKQPVNTISIVVQGMEDSFRHGELDKASMKTSADMIMKQIKYMTETINDFRDFLKPSQEKEKFMACESAISILNLLEPELKKYNINIKVHEHEHFSVTGLPNEFKQAIMNIVVNAADAMEENGVDVGKIEFLFENDGVNGTMRVRDNAGGIPSELLPNKLFESYVTTKGDKGTGLGLNICKVIVEEKMGGKLWAHNVNGGAEFVIELPLAGKMDEAS